MEIHRRSGSGCVSAFLATIIGSTSAGKENLALDCVIVLTVHSQRFCVPTSIPTLHAPLSRPEGKTKHISSPSSPRFTIPFCNAYNKE